MFKFKPEDVTLLKNFASVNSNLAVAGGTKLRTMNIASTLLVDVDLKEEWPPFAIYDLSEFLSVLSMFKEPSTEFNGDHLILSEGHLTVKYRYADVGCFKIKIPTSEIKTPPADAEFLLTQEDIAKVLRMASILKLELLAIESNSAGVSIRAYTPTKNTLSLTNDFVLKIDKAEGGMVGKEWQAVVSIDNLKLIPGGYKVSVHHKNENSGMIVFTSNDDPFKDSLVYRISLDSKQTKFSKE